MYKEVKLDCKNKEKENKNHKKNIWRSIEIYLFDLIWKNKSPVQWKESKEKGMENGKCEEANMYIFNTIQNTQISN